MSSVSTKTYSRTHTAVFVSDKLRNFVKLLIRNYGLDAQKVVDEWSGWVDHAAQLWLESGHLTAIVVEFYWPGSTNAVARWDFPIRYDGNNVDEMWIDRLFFEDSLAKAKAPPAGCTFRIILMTSPGKPEVNGVETCAMLSTDGLVAREAGTIIATPDIMASARYYR